jgi:hypothetical protein
MTKEAKTRRNARMSSGGKQARFKLWDNNNLENQCVRCKSTSEIEKSLAASIEGLNTKETAKERHKREFKDCINLFFSEDGAKYIKRHPIGMEKEKQYIALAKMHESNSNVESIPEVTLSKKLLMLLGNSYLDPVMLSYEIARKREPNNSGERNTLYQNIYKFLTEAEAANLETKPIFTERNLFL